MIFDTEQNQQYNVLYTSLNHLTTCTDHSETDQHSNNNNHIIIDK